MKNTDNSFKGSKGIRCKLAGEVKSRESFSFLRDERREETS